MSHGVPIRFRRTISDTPSDMVYVGQGFFHLHDNKLGIYNGSKMCWYPGIDPLLKMMIMNKGQRLTGKTAAGIQSTIALEFTANSLRVINLLNEQVLASFNADGSAVFANLQNTDILPAGNLSKTSHPGFLPQLFTDAYNSASYTGLVGPNTYLWKKAGGSGDIVVGYSYKEGLGETVHMSAEQFTYKATASAQLSNVGLRTWFLDPTIHQVHDAVQTLITNSHKVFFSYFGPAGVENTFRIGRDGDYTTHTVLGDGKWHRISLDLPVPLHTETFAFSETSPYSLDLMFNTSGPSDWYFGEINVQQTYYHPAEVIQYKSVAERCAIADSYYRKYKNQVFNAGYRRSFSSPLDFSAWHSKAFPIVRAQGGRSVTIENLSRQGFNAFSPDASAGEWLADITAGYIGSLSDIS